MSRQGRALASALLPAIPTHRPPIHRSSWKDYSPKFAVVGLLRLGGHGRGGLQTNGVSASYGRCYTPESIYKTPEGEAAIRVLYDEALAGLGTGHESLTVARASARRTSSRSGPRTPRPRCSSRAATS